MSFDIIVSTARLELTPSMVRFGIKRSRLSGVVAAQKLRNDLDLVVSDQGRRMAAIRNGVDADIAIAPHHVPEDGFGKEIRLLPAYHKNGEVDRVPVFPEIDAVVPGVSKGMGDIRIAQRPEAAPLRAPDHTMRCQMPPVRILQLPERRQNPPVVAFGLFDRLKGSWRLVEIGTETKQSSPGQIGSDIVDDDAADRTARKGGQHHPDQATERRADPVDLRCTEACHQHCHIAAILRQGIVAAVLQPLALSPARQIRANDAPARAGESCGEMIEVPAVSRQSVDTEYWPHRGRRSPIRECDAMEAAAGQPAPRTNTGGR